MGLHRRLQERILQPLSMFLAEEFQVKIKFERSLKVELEPVLSFRCFQSSLRSGRSNADMERSVIGKSKQTKYKLADRAIVE